MEGELGLAFGERHIRCETFWMCRCSLPLIAICQLWALQPHSVALGTTDCMANIYCTKKLEKVVGKALISSEPRTDQRLGGWNANVIYLNKRKCLFLMNDLSYYSLLFLDILKKDILNFQELFYQRLIEQLDHDSVNFPVSCSSLIMNECEPLFLPTNNNRRVLGTMNELRYIIDYWFEMDYYGDLNFVNLPELNHRLTNEYVGALRTGKHYYGNPIEEMRKQIEKVCA